MSSGDTIESLFSTTMENIQDMIDVNTVIGDPLETPDGLLIIPISRVLFGFAVGGGNVPDEQGQGGKGQGGQGGQSASGAGFAGGSGAGVSVQPVAFLIVDQDEISFLPINETNPYLKIAEALPGLAQEMKNLFSGGSGDGDSTVRA